MDIRQICKRRQTIVLIGFWLKASVQYPGCFNMILNCSIGSYPGYLQTVLTIHQPTGWFRFNIQDIDKLSKVHQNICFFKWIFIRWFPFSIQDICKLFAQYFKPYCFYMVCHHGFGSISRIFENCAKDIKPSGFLKWFATRWFRLNI